MKTVILAGGFGTRISEETRVKPKPLIEIGGMPVIWHIMKIYSFYGINDFVVCCGYKGHMIKEYFANHLSSKSNTIFQPQQNKMKTNHKFTEPWTVKLIDTGFETMTGGRLKRVEKFVADDTFCLTYGDDLKNINIAKLINFHKKKKRLATLTTIQPPSRFGILSLKYSKVIRFKEKPPKLNYWVNGGYYILEPDVFDYINGDSTVWECEPLEKLALEGQLSAYKYNGPYQPMDTLRDKNNLEQLWNSGKAYWKVWQ